MRVHHVGYLVKKMDKALITFKELGYSVTKDIIWDEYRGVYICFLEKDGYVIELVSPNSADSVVSNLMKKFGNSPYHICYETTNFDKTVNELLEKKYVMCSEKHEAVALSGKNVCFLVHPYMGMVELVEAEN